MDRRTAVAKKLRILRENVSRRQQIFLSVTRRKIRRRRSVRFLEKKQNIFRREAKTLVCGCMLRLKMS